MIAGWLNFLSNMTINRTAHRCRPLASLFDVTFLPFVRGNRGEAGVALRGCRGSAWRYRLVFATKFRCRTVLMGLRRSRTSISAFLVSTFSIFFSGGATFTIVQETQLGATPATQWFYSSVSKASLQKTGVLPDLAGDFWECWAQKVRTSVSGDFW